MWHYSTFTLATDYRHYVLARAFQGLGYGFFFVSVNIVAYSQLRPDQNNRASSLTNFFRNWGGSFAIALITTVAERRQQFHQANVGSAVSGTSQQFAARTHTGGGLPGQQRFHRPGCCFSRSGRPPSAPATSSEFVGFHGLLPHPGVGHGGGHPAAFRDSTLQAGRESSGGSLNRGTPSYIPT